ncbi:hypothetical protein CERSUDRAFT_124440 [Gelatoporia subvermispora B]|uniref:Glycoside hydrolase family 16 protein n=1 Tax=Ceriporiopsis subvermispora (strain B) TaxID=914234 RepID=M2PI62_CERS8|nr:hypothetical protein CERSUDRAFT_124440 [Gelatoporia subvermispora B]
MYVRQIAYFILCAVSLQSSYLVSAAPTNISIDDTYGDSLTFETFVYSPQDHWSVGQSCKNCVAQPDSSQAFNHTWHESTSGIGHNGSTNATVYFRAFGSEWWGNVDMTFYIDGNVVGEYLDLTPTNDLPGPSYEYSTLVWQAEGLPLEEHSFTLVNGQISHNKSLILLDYVKCTTDLEIMPSSSSDPASDTHGSSSKSRAVAIGLSIPACIITVLLAAAYYICKRQHRSLRTLLVLPVLFKRGDRLQSQHTPARYAGSDNVRTVMSIDSSSLSICDSVSQDTTATTPETPVTSSTNQFKAHRMHHLHVAQTPVHASRISECPDPDSTPSAPPSYWHGSD